MVTNLKVSKTAPTLANLTTPLAPQTPFAPWGNSPQAERLPSGAPHSAFPNSQLISPNYICSFHNFFIPLYVHIYR